MTAKKIIIDCDPGIDDALAIVLAHGSPELEIVGITTVGGNVGLEHTTANALKLREFLGLHGVPVTAGSAGPLLRARVDAAEVHGDSGLGAARLPEPRLRAAPGHAVDFIIDAIAADPGEITLVAIGPLTNVALAVRKEPKLAEMVRELVILGGSYTRGNFTPAAEFNIAADPEAAAIVFEAGWTVTTIGLDAAKHALATGWVVEEMRAMGRLGADLLVPCVEFYGLATAADGPAIYDACAVAHVIDPTLHVFAPAEVNVETVGRWTYGMTVTDFDVRPGRANARVATSLDVARFWDLVLPAYREAAARMGAAETTAEPAP
ncbi:purine nucleosidase [Thermocatellispora tengchongensis]|uniref:Purine nucleosidase n=1 Tax=Thermocatellispora tengchongensis TaxID=1073253 RepID=A0A840PBY6_9ACTN|nr:nucleoside hydrolase [Thermocatellispora tengchongensis]MBB5136499.1 purine nucleosidase [Thermocatellispora tengchongensis]